MTKREEFEALETLSNKLNGIAAKLSVMAAAYQDAAGTPANKITEAALLSLADELEDARDTVDGITSEVLKTE